MSRYFTKTLASLEPYTPGEQLKIADIVKLNANENPYPPAPGVAAAVAAAVPGLRLYSDLTNGDLNAAIAKLGGLKIEVGGGIRDEARIQRYLDLGAGRCILGTVAVKNFDFTAEMAQKYGAQIAVGVDMKDGAVAVNGWKEVTPEPGVAFCRRCANAGVKAIIATDISRDGTMQGTNMALYRELLTIPGIEVTASGGIAAMAELAELSAMHCHAAILGKSIYTGAIDLAEAVRLYEGE